MGIRDLFGGAVLGAFMAWDAVRGRHYNFFDDQDYDDEPPNQATQNQPARTPPAPPSRRANNVTSLQANLLHTLKKDDQDYGQPPQNQANEDSIPAYALNTPSHLSLQQAQLIQAWRNGNGPEPLNPALTKVLTEALRKDLEAYDALLEPRPRSGINSPKALPEATLDRAKDQIRKRWDAWGVAPAPVSEEEIKSALSKAAGVTLDDNSIHPDDLKSLMSFANDYEDSVVRHRVKQEIVARFPEKLLSREAIEGIARELGFANGALRGNVMEGLMAYSEELHKSGGPRMPPGIKKNIEMAILREFPKMSQEAIENMARACGTFHKDDTKHLLDYFEKLHASGGPRMASYHKERFKSIIRKKYLESITRQPLSEENIIEIAKSKVAREDGWINPRDLADLKQFADLLIVHAVSRESRFG